MAVAHDGEANVTNAAGGSSATITCAAKTTAGSNRYGVVAIAASSDAATGVTWGGVAMTQIGKVVDPGEGATAYLYGIIAPATASSDVVASFSPNVTGVMTASSYVDVHQTVSTGTAATASGNATPATVNVTSATNDMVVDSLYFSGAGTPPAEGADQTDVGTADQGGWWGASSYEAGAATVTMSWTLTSAVEWSLVGIPLKPTAGGGGGGGNTIAWIRA